MHIHAVVIVHCLFLFVFRACIDTSEGGRLEECNLLGPFNLTGDFAKIGDKGL